MKFNVAIDGPSGAGKSVIALRLAKRFNLLHINSGSMYRALSYHALQVNVDLLNEQALSDLIDDLQLELTKDQKVFVKGQEITSEIRNDQISKLASDISKFPKVREKLVALQQQMVAQKNCIMEGRDITTVVIPDAEIKIFLTASVDVRAKRRTLDLLARGYTADFEQVKQDIILRDYQDSHRDIAPLMIAKDAIVVDTTHLSLDEVTDHISQMINQKIGR